jgi:hypothetical protein
MYYYEFRVNKRRGDTGSRLKWDFISTSYVASTEAPITHHEAAKLASILGNAERCLYPKNINFISVVLYELRVGQGYSIETRTRSLFPWNDAQNTTKKQIVGLRPTNESFNQWAGAYIVQEREQGHPRRTFMRGVLSFWDAYEFKEHIGGPRGLLLDLDAPLAGLWWHGYKALLEYATLLDYTVLVTQDGVPETVPPCSNERVLHLPGIQLWQKKNFERQSGGQRETTRLVNEAHAGMWDVYREYSLGMKYFNYEWSSSSYPAWRFLATTMSRVTQIWYPLARALGYQILPGSEPAEDELIYDDPAMFSIVPGSVVLSDQEPEVYRILLYLQQVWQHIRQYRFEASVWWEHDVYSPQEEWAEIALIKYDQYYALMDTIAAVNDSINVLMRLWRVQPRGAAPGGAKVGTVRFSDISKKKTRGMYSTTVTLDYTHYFEALERARGNWYTEPEPPEPWPTVPYQPPVNAPRSSPIAWNPYIDLPPYNFWDDLSQSIVWNAVGNYVDRVFGPLAPLIQVPGSGPLAPPPSREI